MKMDENCIGMQICVLCQRKKAKKGCDQKACINCCTLKSCQIHEEIKQKRKALEEDIYDEENELCSKKRKLVFKNLFKEPNFKYFKDTVTIFSAQDFFSSKKLSQGVLNDLSRSKRASNKLPSFLRKTNSSNGKSIKKWDEILIDKIKSKKFVA